VVALAHQGLGEHLAARAALQAAVEAAPAGDRPTYQRQLGRLVDDVARRLLAEAAQHPRGDSPECLERTRTALAWLEHGVAAVPTDAALAELSLGAQAALWRAYERSAMALLQRQEFGPARRLLHEALLDPLVPPERVDAFHELFTRTFSGEVGQLTAHAIRSVQEGREADALGAVQRAEALLATLSEEALSPKRREEVDRRRWWVYSHLGERRLDFCEFEAALEPLVRALGCDVGAERHEQTRLLLERALEGVPDREAAIVHCDRLWARLRGPRETLAGDLAGAGGTPFAASQER
jgi:tetratricopeptide (TPR) repeat protein